MANTGFIFVFLIEIKQAANKTRAVISKLDSFVIALIKMLSPALAIRAIIVGRKVDNIVFI